MFGEIARKYSRVFLEPMARFIERTGLSPNFVTVIGFILMVGVALVLAQGYLLFGGLLIIAVVILDALDGTLARMIGRTSRFGAFLDSTLDRFSEAAIFLGIFVHLIKEGKEGFKTKLVLIYATVVGSLMVSYSRARAEGIGVPLKDGLFTRFERIFVLCMGLIAGPLFNRHALTIALVVLAFFTNFTALQRMYKVWCITHREDEE